MYSHSGRPQFVAGGAYALAAIAALISVLPAFSQGRSGTTGPGGTSSPGGGSATGMGAGFSGGGASFGNTGTGFGSSSSSFAPSSLTGTSIQGTNIQPSGFGSNYSGSGLGSGVSGGVSQSNPFRALYANPQAGGLPGSRTTFGSPLWNITTTTTTQTGVGRMQGGAGYGSTSGGAGYAGLGGSNTGVSRAPSYSAALGFAYSRPAPSRIQGEVDQLLARSTTLSPGRSIRVELFKDTVVLQGVVASDHDRQLAEGMVRLTPGVHNVRNELRTANTLPVPMIIP